MNYCSNCGSDKIEFKIPEGDTRDRFVCPECDTIHYQNPRVVVGCLPIYKGKIVLGRRGIEPQKGKWNIPQGFMELGETLEEGALRETFEETGVTPKIIRLITVYSVPHANQVHVHFLTEVDSADFVTSEESPEVKIYAPGEIPWEDIAFSSNTFTLTHYLKNPDSEEVFVGTKSKSY